MQCLLATYSLRQSCNFEGKGLGSCGIFLYPLELFTEQTETDSRNCPLAEVVALKQRKWMKYRMIICKCILHQFRVPRKRCLAQNAQRNGRHTWNITCGTFLFFCDTKPTATCDGGFIEVSKNHLARFTRLRMRLVSLRGQVHTAEEVMHHRQLGDSCAMDSQFTSCAKLELRASP